MNAETLMIPYGKTDFAVMRREGYYYVDKTRFIPMLEREGNFVFFLRPRRFGKSLMLNVLQAYYDVNYADEFDVLFRGLDVYKNPTKLHNQYLVLKFNFSAVNPDKEKVQASFNTEVLLILQSFVKKYASLLPEGTIEQLSQIKECDTALNYVFSQVKEARQRIYLLIDEYDNFANTMMADNEDDYLRLTHGDGFFRLFFNIVKKATTDLDAAVERMFITGVTPLTLSDVTSGFNIGGNFSMKPNYQEMIGFSEDEVRAMFEYYRDATGLFKHSVDELIEVMKPWYSNYCFAKDCNEDQRMFNPGMVLYFLEIYLSNLGCLPEKMVDPNACIDYDKMREMVKLDKSYGDKERILQQIFENRSISQIKTISSLYELQRVENLPSILFNMGLLTYGMDSKGHPALVVPNQAAYEQYSNFYFMIMQ